MMGDFARKQLEKYGWKEGECSLDSNTSYLEYNMLYGAHCAGQGLGKNGEGMSEPVKVKLKRDTVGVSEPWQAIDEL